MTVTEAVSPPRRRLLLTAGDRDRISGWAEADHPIEACGILIGTVAGDLVTVHEVRRTKNLELRFATSRYELDPRAHLTAWRQARDRGLVVVGFWHSHPDAEPEPSPLDLEQAWPDTSYLIVGVKRVGGSGGTPKAGTPTPAEAGEMRSWRLHRGRFIEEILAS